MQQEAFPSADVSNYFFGVGLPLYIFNALALQDINPAHTDETVWKDAMNAGDSLCPIHFHPSAQTS